MDDESGELMEMMEEMSLKELGGAELVDGGKPRELIPETSGRILERTICYS